MKGGAQVDADAVSDALGGTRTRSLRSAHWKEGSHTVVSADDQDDSERERERGGQRRAQTTAVNEVSGRQK